MKTFLLFAMAFCFFACKKDSQNVPDAALNGHWQMTDSYIGNGDGSVTHQKVTDVIFRFTETDSLYRLYGDVLNNTILVNLTDSSYIAKESPLPYRYAITGNTMEVKHPCDEGCRWLFTKLEDYPFPLN